MINSITLLFIASQTWGKNATLSNVIFVTIYTIPYRKYTAKSAIFILYLATNIAKNVGALNMTLVK